jgi:ubiquinol-cytochrome c reductase cytochrome c1 subunit
MFRLNRLAAAGRIVSARTQSTSASGKQNEKSKLVVAAATGTAIAAAGAAALFSESIIFASSDVLHAPSYPWSHKGRLTSFDHGAIRRGFQGEWALIEP